MIIVLGWRPVCSCRSADFEIAQSSIKLSTWPVLRTIGGNFPTPDETEIPLMPVTWTPSFRTLVMFVLVSANKMLAPESTRTRRVLIPPPTVVTVGESLVKVKMVDENWSATASCATVDVEVKVELEVREGDDTDTIELSTDSHNSIRAVRSPASFTR